MNNTTWCPVPIHPEARTGNSTNHHLSPHKNATQGLVCTASTPLRTLTLWTPRSTSLPSGQSATQRVTWTLWNCPVTLQPPHFLNPQSPPGPLTLPHYLYSLQHPQYPDELTPQHPQHRNTPTPQGVICLTPQSPQIPQALNQTSSTCEMRTLMMLMMNPLTYSPSKK